MIRVKPKYIVDPTQSDGSLFPGMAMSAMDAIMKFK